MKALYFIFLVFFITACDPTRTTLFHVRNQTVYDVSMLLYSDGEAIKIFQIAKKTTKVIFSDSGITPIAFQPTDYDSIKFSFENFGSIMFVNDTIHTLNDIYNGYNWLSYYNDRTHTQIFTYTIVNDMIQ